MNRRQRKKQEKMRVKRMLERYPFLRDSLCEYDSLYPGWKSGFGKFLLEDLRAACLQAGCLHELYFLQIKEKYGSLRIYPAFSAPEVEKVLEAYDFISQYVCHSCGSPDAAVVNDYGWELPYCQDCWEKGNRRRTEQGYTVRSWEDVTARVHVGLTDEYKVTRFSTEGTQTIRYDISGITNKIWRKWDPDFAKATSAEKEQMDAAEQELQQGIYCTEEEVWHDE